MLTRVGRSGGDAGGGGDHELASRDLEDLLERRHDPGDQQLAVGVVDREPAGDDELVATGSYDEHVRQPAEQPVRHGDQQLVADAVAPVVVDHLEAVEVEQHQSDVAVGDGRAWQLVDEVLGQPGAVGQPGQGVAGRQPGQVRLGGGVLVDRPHGAAEHGRDQDRDADGKDDPVPQQRRRVHQHHDGRRHDGEGDRSQSPPRHRLHLAGLRVGEQPHRGVHGGGAEEAVRDEVGRVEEAGVRVGQPGQLHRVAGVADQDGAEGDAEEPEGGGTRHVGEGELQQDEQQEHVDRRVDGRDDVEQRTAGVLREGRLDQEGDGGDGAGGPDDDRVSERRPVLARPPAVQQADQGDAQEGVAGEGEAVGGQRGELAVALR